MEKRSKITLKIANGECENCGDFTSCVYNLRLEKKRMICKFCDKALYEQVARVEKDMWISGKKVWES